MDSNDASVQSICLAVWRARMPNKLFYGLMSAILSATLMFAVYHGERVVAAIVVAFGVFGLVGWVRKMTEGVSPLAMFDLKHGSWGFLAMGILLAGAGYEEAGVWHHLRPSGLIAVLPTRWYDQWYWWLIAGALVLGYAVIFRKGEAKNYQDYLRFDSFGKIAHDYLAVPISFVVVVLAVPILVAGNWSDPGPLIVILGLVVLWAVIGPIDLSRTKWNNDWRLSREHLHVQGRVSGSPYEPILAGALSATAFRSSLRDQRPGGKHQHRPG